MRKLLSKLEWWLIPGLTCRAREYDVVRRFLKKGNGRRTLDELLCYLEELDKFTRILGMDYVSPGGFITVCDDIYGYEAKISKGLENPEMVDTCPQYYGLDREEGARLFEAIIGCIPTSTAYCEKHKELLTAGKTSEVKNE